MFSKVGRVVPRGVAQRTLRGIDELKSRFEKCCLLQREHETWVFIELLKAARNRLHLCRREVREVRDDLGKRLEIAKRGLFVEGSSLCRLRQSLIQLRVGGQCGDRRKAENLAPLVDPVENLLGR